MYFEMHKTFLSYVGRWRHKIRKIAVEILQNVNDRMQTLREILRMVNIEIVINSLLGRLTFKFYFQDTRTPVSFAVPVSHS